jgi:hypothetical protein
MYDATALSKAARRRRFFVAVNAAYAELRNREDDWKDLEEERSAWEATLLDGLPADEPLKEDCALTDG